MSTLKQQQQSRIQYLQQIEEYRAKKKQEALEKAAEEGTQYQPPIERPNVNEILNQGGTTMENRQKGLRDLYNKMYNIYKSNPEKMANVNDVYKSVGYDTMDKQQKQIVDYFLGGKQIKQNVEEGEEENDDEEIQEEESQNPEDYYMYNDDSPINF